MQYRFGSQRRGGSERYAAAQRAQVAKRRRVEPHRERLVEDRQEIGVVIEAVFERAVGEKDLNEKRLAAALSVGTAARVPSARFEPPVFAVSPDG